MVLAVTLTSNRLCLELQKVPYYLLMEQALPALLEPVQVLPYRHPPLLLLEKAAKNT